jgi:hypothetical protein
VSGAVLGLVAALHKEKETTPYVRQTYKRAVYVKQIYPRKPYTRAAFQRKQFTRQSFQGTEYQRQAFDAGKYEVVKQVSTNSSYVGKCSDGTWFESRTVDGLQQEFDAHKAASMLKHELTEKANQKAHALDMKAKENQHNANQDAQEKKHNVKQQQLLQEHNINQDAEENKHSEIQDTKEKQHNIEQDTKEYQHNEIQDNNEQIHNEAERLREWTLKDQAVRSHIDGGIWDGAMGALAVSGAKNIGAYWSGGKSGVDAAMDTMRDAGTGAAVGGATGFFVAGIERATGTNIGGYIPGVFMAGEACHSIYKWCRGEISGQDCAMSIARSIAVKAAGGQAVSVVGTAVFAGLSLFTTAGVVLWALPVVAGALAYKGGADVSTSSRQDTQMVAEQKEDTSSL